MPARPGNVLVSRPPAPAPAPSVPGSKGSVVILHHGEGKERRSASISHGSALDTFSMAPSSYTASPCLLSAPVKALLSSPRSPPRLAAHHRQLRSQGPPQERIVQRTLVSPSSPSSTDKPSSLARTASDAPPNEKIARHTSRLKRASASYGPRTPHAASTSAHHRRRGQRGAARRSSLVLLLVSMVVSMSEPGSAS
ncbi:hypothetical protein C8R46DRAFT_1236098 [Mycena filopes]|nr:hypothetical protein C8R46DRAFT_1236098 [Mycena filopes]